MAATNRSRASSFRATMCFSTMPTNRSTSGAGTRLSETKRKKTGRSGSGPILGRSPISAILRSEEHTSELQSLMRISYAVFCLNKKKENNIMYYRHINSRNDLHKIRHEHY